MTFFERIKQMTEKEMKMFIYWVYERGWDDHSNGVEDSPGDWSFFGGAICDQPAESVEAKLDEYYDRDWRDEPMCIWVIMADDLADNVYRFERKLRSNHLASELEKFKTEVLESLGYGASILCGYRKNNVEYCGRFDEWLKDKNGGADTDVE